MKKLVLLMAMFFLPTVVYASEITVTVDGVPIVFEDVQPTIVGGHTLVPLRGVFEVMGFTVEWDEANAEAMLTDSYTVIQAWPGMGFNIMTGNTAVSHPSPPLVDGRFMLPIRLVAEATGAVVEWDEDTRTVSIYTRQQIITMRHHTADDIVASVNGYHFVRGEMIVIAGFGMTFHSMAAYVGEFGGEIVGFLEVPNTYQIYFHDTDEETLRALIAHFNAKPDILIASLNMVSPL